jgi:ATP-dependent RNA helicase RhlE
MNTFSEISLSPVLQTNLARHNFVQPTAVQTKTISPALAGHDIVATAQTGTGKTLAFVLPLLESLIKNPAAGVSAVILSPTRELAIQTDETFAKMAAGTGLRAAVVVGGLSESVQLRAVRKGAHVIIATPGRLCDFLNRKLVNLSGVRVLVLDEADRMLDMGFLPAIQTITKTIPAVRQTLCFSATIEASVARAIETQVKNPVRVTIGSITKPVDSVNLHFYEVEQDRKLGLLQHMLKEEQGSFLVFARTKHGADRLAKKLVNGSVKATRIHGDRTQSQRNQALQGFQDGYYRVMVATDVAARGIHVEGIAHVVNYDLPQAPEDFIHRVGRTGRAGAQGTASTFGTRSERSDIRNIERKLNIQLIRREVSAEVPREVKKPTAEIVPFPKPRGASSVQFKSKRRFGSR